MRKCALHIVSLFLLFFSSIAIAGDWPQFLGPGRDGTSQEMGLCAGWGRNGPPVLWKKTVGEGYSGPVIAGDRLIVFHRLNNKEVVACWNAKNGKEIWTKSYPCAYADGLGKGNGPRSTPVIADGRVYTLGVTGELCAWAVKDGKKLWSRNIKKDYNVPASYFGVGTSPVVVDGKVLVNVGGRSAGIVAFDAKSGAESWKATTDGASYSSPAIAKIGGKERAVFLTRLGVVVLDPKTGKVQHHQRWRARYAASVNAATPLVIDDMLFVSACYETGALLLQAKNGKFREIWNSDEKMSNHYNTCIYQQGYLYGIHGRQEATPDLRCIELKTGKVMWTKGSYGCASMILADGKIIALTEGGDLVLFQPTPTKYREISRAHVFNDTPCRAQIALANGRLYARDGSHMVCFDLRKQ